MATTNIIITAINDAAVSTDFKRAFGGWFKESGEVIVVLDLQRSYYSALYYLNIKISIKGSFGKDYAVTKSLIKKDIGNVFLREPKEYAHIMNLEKEMPDYERAEKIKNMFLDFISPFAESALTCEGISVLANEGKVTLLPAVKKELDRLMH